MLKIFVIAILVTAALGSSMYNKARYGQYLPDVQEAPPYRDGGSLADAWRNLIGSMPYFNGTTTNLR
jgi:hypothetical protein